MVGRLDIIRHQLALSARTARRGLLIAAACGAALACNEAPKCAVAAAPPQGEGGSPYSLDSALTLFRIGLESVSELEDAEPSMEAVVRRLMVALQRSDTATLRQIVMTRREFAWLYYPTSPFTKAPTKQEPGLVWFLHIQHSQKGASRLLDRYGGRPVPIVSNVCQAPPRREGENVLWDDCVQRLVVEGDTVVIRLFGGIYERRGRFKIFSFSNDL